MDSEREKNVPVKQQISEEECISNVYILNPNTTKKQQNLSVFKIFGNLNFSFEAADAQSKVDWSGLYTQLDPIHSMRYLTKKWDDGAEYACLVNIRLKSTINNKSYLQKQQENANTGNKNGENHQKISTKMQKHQKKQTNQKLKLLTIQHPILCQHSIPGNLKANLIRSHLIEKYEFISNLSSAQKPLLQALGQHNLLLQCVDCQDQEIIFSHDLLRQQKQKFQFVGIIQLKKSQDGMLRTIGWRQYNTELNEDEGWNFVKGQCQFQPYLLIQQVNQVKNLVENKSYNFAQ